MNTLIISAADTNFFELVQGTIRSIRDRPEGEDIAIAFLDLGCTASELEWLQANVNIIRQPGWDFDFPSRERSPEYLKGMLARPHLRQYFPGFDVYLWIDADAWVQDWYAIELFIRGATRKGLAIAPEMDRASVWEFSRRAEFCDWQFRRYKSFFGDRVAEKLHTYPMLNAGVFALHKDAPHWAVWASVLHEGLQNCANIMTDQFALNYAVYEHGLFDRTEMLPAWANWLLSKASPSVDCQKFSFVEPYLPHQPIGIIHIAGGGKGSDKSQQLKLSTTSGGTVKVGIRYPTFKQQKEDACALHAKIKQISLTSNDYISPNLEVIFPDPCLPHLATSNLTSNRSYISQAEPINSYYSNRSLLGRAEMQIVYNIALQYKGKRGLVIGCQMGWISCHIAISGMELDILDPQLLDRELLQAVMDSINSAKAVFGTIGTVTCVPCAGSEVSALANDLQRQWSSICIDANSLFASANRDDSILDVAIACEPYTAADATIIFANCLEVDRDHIFAYFKTKGWQTKIYETFPPLVIVWRGGIEPVEFFPDPHSIKSIAKSQVEPAQHILLCTGDRGVGGVAKYNHSLLCALASKGYKVTCVQPQAVDTDAVYMHQQLGIRHLWFEHAQTQAELNKIFNIASERPHLIISSNTSPFSNMDIQSTAIEFGIPYIIVEGLVTPEYLKQEAPHRIKQLALHYTQAQQTIAVSTENLNLLHQQFGLPRDRGRVIYYGRPPQYFTPRDLDNSKRLRQSLQIPDDAIVCFTSARIEIRKGYHYQLEAIQTLMTTPVWERLYFVWAGGGIFRPELEAQIKEVLQQLGVADKVKFLGQVQDVSAWLDLADIFILPSQNEGMPLSIIEAMAKGIAIIATAVGGIPEALGSTGRLIPDPKTDARAITIELVRAIQELATQTELRDRLGRDAKQRAEQLFNEERMLEETIAEIQTAIKESVSTRSGR